MKRRLLIAPGGADSLDAAAEAPTEGDASITPAAWERFSADAVWCSLDGLTTDHNGLRCAIGDPFAVLEVQVGGEREAEIVVATEALGRFWKLCGLWSLLPRALPEVHPGLYDAVAAWTRGEEADVSGLPRVQRLRLGRGDELEQEEFLVDHDGAWLRCRRIELEEEGPAVLVDAFSMKQHVLDLSALLALSVAPD